MQDGAYITTFMNLPFEIKGGEIIFNPITKKRFVEQYEGKSGVCEIRKSKRSDRQNRALHKYFSLLAEALNDGGFNVQLVLKEKVEIDWTPEMCKEILWRTAQRVILKKESTTELAKGNDIDVVYSHLNRHLSEKFGLHVPFPAFESEEAYNEATGLSTY